MLLAGGIRLETPVEEHNRTVAVESPLPEDMRALLDAENMKIR